MFQFRKNLYITSHLCKRFINSTTSISKTRKKSSTTNDDVIFQDLGDKGIIILNRPKSLNTLTFPMVTSIYQKLPEWEREKTLVVIKGTGDRAFCAGGDLKEMTSLDAADRSAYFKQEYITNGIVGSYKIPYIALIDGILMGGGVGMSVHGPYRVATERSIFAMPETRIGLFPDVGTSYFLPRLRGKLGLFLGLTGYRVKGADLLKTGIATHYVNSQSLESLERDLLKCSDVKSIDSTLDKYSLDDNKEFSLEPLMEQINRCFSAGSPEEIIERLEEDGSQFAKDVVQLLGTMSPTSLKVTMKLLEYGSKMTLKECLQMNYRVAMHFLEKTDFYEGVRALIIDKDNQPAWNPPRLSEVTPIDVDSYFTKLPEDQELRHP